MAKLFAGMTDEEKKSVAKLSVKLAVQTEENVGLVKKNAGLEAVRKE